MIVHGKDDGGAAFPRSGRDHQQRGMSKRDYFAAAALTACIRRWQADFMQGEMEINTALLAAAAYDFADAMIEARDK